MSQPDQCYPMTVLPHISTLYADYLALSDAPAAAPVRRWYGTEPAGGSWIGCSIPAVDSEGLANALSRQTAAFGAGPAALANIQRLRHGARAVVTGQQVGLFGGPLLTLLKAATAVARAAEATQRTGIDHVPVFWLATEDHDLAEVDQVAFPGRHQMETIRLGLIESTQPVGGLELDDAEALNAALEQTSELLGWAPICDLLREFYAPGATLGGAFARLLTELFAAHGLIVMDAAGPDFHALGRATLRLAIQQADALEAALLARTRELETAGYQAQVLVVPGHSLLFLLHPETGARQPLRRTADGGWKAGGRAYTTAELLEILETSPQRLSPNALLRPVFQDTILPVAAYIGGPAEIAYFAQSEVLYRAILGRLTPSCRAFRQPSSSPPSPPSWIATSSSWPTSSRRRLPRRWPSASARAPCPSKANAS